MINPRIAITAAHCVQEREVLDGLQVEVESRTYDVEDIMVPKCWKENEVQLQGYDIALLILTEEIADAKRG